MKTIVIGPRTSLPLHVEADGCIINIRPGLNTMDGHAVTSVQVLCDSGWSLPDHKHDGLPREGINVRVVRQDR